MTDETIASELVPLAAQLVGTLRDYSPEDVAAILDPLPESHLYRLTIILAAMVDPDASPSELLAWTTGGPVESRKFTPPAYDIKNLSEHAFGRHAERRQEIIRLTNEGLSRPQIAARLGVTVRCVERHRAAIRNALEEAS